MLFPIASPAQHLKKLLLLQRFNFSVGELNGSNRELTFKYFPQISMCFRRLEIPCWEGAKVSQLIACKERNLPAVFEVCPRAGKDVWRLHSSPIKRRTLHSSPSWVWQCACGKMRSKVSVLNLNSGKDCLHSGK